MYNGEVLEDLELKGVIIFNNQDIAYDDFILIFQNFLAKNNWHFSGEINPLDWK